MKTLSLSITTPMRLLVKAERVASLRAEDESGGFGILPGHADLVTTLPSSVVSWRYEEGPWLYCVVSNAVLSVTDGSSVAIACRRGLVGDQLDALQDQVRALRAADLDAERRARVEQVKLHARAVRQLMLLLGGSSAAARPSGPAGPP